jgi:hypothetical protein
MPIIRKEQMAELERYALGQYASSALDQLRTYYPRHCEIAGDGPMLDMILLAVARAKTHGIVGECNVVLYTSLMLLFGSFFDRDPQCDWASDLLDGADPRDETTLAEQLYERGTLHWERIAGEDNVNLVRALMHIRTLGYDAIAANPPEALRELLWPRFPEKVAALGEAGLNRLVASLRQRCAAYGPTSAPLLSTLGLAACFLGVGLDADPMFPWAGAILADPDLAPDDKARRLHERCIRHAQDWLAHVARRSR